MVKVVYEVVEHDGGWAYKYGDVFSETFPTHQAAHAAAERAAAEQRVPAGPKRSSTRTARASGTRKPPRAATGPSQRWWINQNPERRGFLPHGGAPRFTSGRKPV